MERLSVCTYALLLCLICGAQEKPREQSAVGLDITSIVRSGSLKAGICHCFLPGWSAAACAELDFRTLADMPDSVEKTHYGEFGEDGWPYVNASYTMSISVQHWPDTFCRGAFISAGMIWKQGTGLDMTAGAGYAVRIWKGLTLYGAYGLGILETCRNGKMTGNEISIGIGYMF